ncbi:MAG TPA: hypothetical protein VNN77_00175 [candidate division Zixibacteria bacterium]|nr:hypothetical protein [candidate division Zixibacteria bacterium]
MDIIGEYLRRLLWELSPYLDWAIRHWPLTFGVVVVGVYLAGRHKRLDRHRL